ncbi:MAG: rod shape-determining protein MreD, partial [Rickettsiales bacterium]|nr:rod shape-determining protein MreD [Rickettsiales bacterium]
LSHFMPVLPILPMFYWGMMQARDMPYWFVFAIGLVMDSVMGLPLGLSSLLFIFFLVMVHAQRKYFHKEAFVIKWGYFAILLGIASIANWLLLTFFIQHSEPFVPALLQWLLTMCLYPVMHAFFDGLYEHIHSRRWQILHGMR